ncbi:hypothetical protein trd_1475 [Thermomicrobium roseum DSM 5159]|uniref:Uncharacterized protein n=1 Tax=Thermomicrobium roseum (strain ATCC 27502 / DSM 5159 / P-2) TaxID=309801 RepID=B9KZK5_THERP|nr:hypothetical protein trd_1475 [Thermomicrobium roseum DSM 5159]
MTPPCPLSAAVSREPARLRACAGIMIDCRVSDGGRGW